MNLVLIGYRGTGKSTVGNLLASLTELEYVGLDSEIVKRAGMSIPEIVKCHSWDYFRDLEEQVVDHFSGLDNLILDTGGGVVTRPANVARLRSNGFLFLLEASVGQIIERIGEDDQRPSLTGEKTFLEEISEVLKSRQAAYEEAADFRIDTSGRTPEEVARQVFEIFQESRGSFSR